METSPEQLYNLFDQTPAAIAILNGKNHVFAYANARYFALAGKQRTIIGQTAAVAFPEIEGQGFLEILDQIYETAEPYIGKEMPVDLEMHGSGKLTKLYVNLTYQPLLSEDGSVEGIMVHATDETEQVLARRKISEKEERYSALFNAIDQGFCVIEIIFDKHQKPVDYKFLEVNKLFESQTGLENVIGKTAKQSIPGIEQEWVKRYAEILKTGKPARFTQNSEALGRWYDVYAIKVGDKDSRKVAILFSDVSAKKKAEDKLLRSEEQYRTVVESLEEGVSLLDASGKIISANASAGRLLGLTLKQMRGRDSLDERWKSLHEDGSEMPGTEHAPQHVLRTGKAYTNQIIGIRKPNGELSWLNVSAQPIFDGEVLSGVVASFFDITLRKRVEHALKQQLELTETITNIASSGLCMLDESGLVTYMNPSAEHVTGYSLKQAMGKPFHDLIHHSYPDGSPYPSSQCGMVDTYKYGKFNPLHEDIFYRKNGNQFWAMITATPIPGLDSKRSTVIEFRDITEEKRATQTLAESEARLRFMSESMPQKVFTADADGNVDYFNGEWMKFTGLSFELIQNWGWTKIIHPDDLAENIRLWKRSIKTGEPFLVEHRFRRYDGAYHWHLSRARPMRDETGVIIRWFGSNTDVNEIKTTLQRKNELEHSTAELKEQRTQLVALNQAKDEFISLASHQLRTPASATKQFLGMVLEGYAGKVPDQQLELLERARDSNERQIIIVNDLLKVALVDSGKIYINKQPVEIIKFVEDIIIDQSAKIVDHEQRVSYVHKQRTLKASIDANRVRMVLENLLDNASKYTHAGKLITVTVEKTKGRLIISIKDEGVGMSKTDIGKLFRKFSRLDNPLSVSAGGTGLGLYWGDKIINLHGGTIEVSSKVGQGSTFSVNLAL